MQGQPDKDPKTAQRGEPHLQLAMTIFGTVAFLAGVPFCGLHTGACHRRAHVTAGDGLSVPEHHHPTIQDVESEMVLTPDERSHLALQNRDFFRAIKAVDLEYKPCCGARDLGYGLCVRATVVTMLVCMFTVTMRARVFVRM
ncbi:hypothetical protein [Marinobacter salarius]|uniref:hypothetical protein n=1 Tax=Marinobacter salarius TaxID=1420917 RepID=UPI0032ECE3CD